MGSRVFVLLLGFSILAAACSHGRTSGARPSTSPKQSANPGDALSIARHLYADWKAGNTVDASALATPQAVNALFAVAYAGRYREPESCSAGTPLACMAMQGASRVLFQVQPADGAYRVVAVNFGTCQGTQCRFTLDSPAA
jgi:hypothetical protein